MSRPRLCYVSTVPSAVASFLNTHIDMMAETHDVFVVTDFSAGPGDVSSRATRIHAVIPRKISLLRDLAGLIALWRIFRAQRFDIVHSVMPKSGLLAMAAACLAGVPLRIHWFTGQVWATRTGFGRRLLKGADRLIVAFASRILVDSPSQKEFLVAEGIARADQLDVLGEGSICGVDTQRFRPDPVARHETRAQYGIPDDAVVVLFLGRMNGDKGLRELGAAMTPLNVEFPKLHWLIVGPDEEDFTPILQQVGGGSGRLHMPGFTRTPERCMAAADIFCLPSYREGFGSALLEAASVGVPAVASRIYGLTDAVVDGVTGVLVTPRDVAALQSGLRRLVADETLRRRLGEAAHSRAVRDFSRERVSAELRAYYAKSMYAKSMD